jgi:DedD protein
MAFLFDTKEELEEKQARRAPRSSAALGRAVGADTEIALGTRSLLGIFFGLVLICSIFFGLGYSVGRAGGSRAAVQPPDLAPTPDSHISKPSAEQTLTPVEQPPATADEDNGAPTTPAPQPSSAQTQPPPSAPVPGNTAQAPARTPASTPATSPANPAPVLTPAAASMQTTFMVQVAAVRIQQDAEILVDALKKHGYTAVVRNEPQDQLLHIQLGPYNSRTDAMAMRAKLLSDGYNAVIK